MSGDEIPELGPLCRAVEDGTRCCRDVVPGWHLCAPHLRRANNIPTAPLEGFLPPVTRQEKASPEGPCRFCGESYDAHAADRDENAPVPRMPCLGLRVNFSERPPPVSFVGRGRRRDWADDWADALHTLFLDGEGDEEVLFRRVRAALLAAHEAGQRGESLFAVELPTEVTR